ncbi:MAG: WYL domain-containing protein [Bacteroidetes bacterium]|nr:MAG: WYL domain-containing protein [Bacteroidota bacterium]
MAYDDRPRERLLRVLMYMVEHPQGLTRKELAARLQVSEKVIKTCINAIENVGFEVGYDIQYHTYRLVPNKRTEKLSRLLYFTPAEQEMIRQAIDQVYKFSHASETLKRKLSSIYDYQRLGTVGFRKPLLNRIAMLDKAIKDKKQVILQAYRSNNSETVADRLVEAFHLNVPEDIVQAYDLQRQGLRYFRLSRMERVLVQDTSWQYQSRHLIMPADPFRIVQKQQVMVHFRMQVSVYNDLIDLFPLTKNCIEPANEPGWYDFQGEVNASYLAIGNFLLGHGSKVEILFPEDLRDWLNAQARKLRF